MEGVGWRVVGVCSRIGPGGTHGIAWGLDRAPPRPRSMATQASVGATAARITQESGDRGQGCRDGDGWLQFDGLMDQSTNDHDSATKLQTWYTGYGGPTPLLAPGGNRTRDLPAIKLLL